MAVRAHSRVYARALSFLFDSDMGGWVIGWGGCGSTETEKQKQKNRKTIMRILLLLCALRVAGSVAAVAIL